jgi:uncharacterized membrane protein HdeD (DUF308 family)
MESHNWGWVVARGVVAVLFGLMALVFPSAAFVAMVAVFAAYAFVEGVASVIMSVRSPARGAGPAWALLLEGICGIAVAVLLLVRPARTILALLLILGAFAIITGVMEIAAAIRLRRVIRGEWMLGLAGLLSVAFGVLIWAWPAAGALTLVWWTGAYALIFGALFIALGIRLSRHQREARPRHVPLRGLSQRA